MTIRHLSDLPSRRGVYTAPRASALAGVPESTMYEWARGDEPLLVPSISSTKVKLWSWTDLVALRAIRWLRHPDAEDARRSTAMRRVRDLIREVEVAAGRLGEALADASLTLRVDAHGSIYIETSTVPLKRLDRWPQFVGRELVVDLLSVFSVDDAVRGPHLLRPREHLRIVPGKLAGEPHVAGTRIETRVLAALSERGMLPRAIRELYPSLSEDAIDESLDLERQLGRNANAAA